MLSLNKENDQPRVNNSQFIPPLSKQSLKLNRDKKKVTASLMRELKIDNALIADQFATKIFATQKTLDHFQSITIPAFDSVPYKVVVSKERVHFIIEKISAGTFSKVYKTVVIATAVQSLGDVCLSVGESLTLAMKKTKKLRENSKGELIQVRTFKHESSTLRSAIGGKTKGLDIFYAIFEDAKKAYSLHNLYDCNLQKVKFHEMSDPVLSMITCLLGPSKGLKTLHASDHVHRDIKGLNIVVSFPKEKVLPKEGDKVLKKNKIRCDLTDFGSLQKRKEEEHSTHGTVPYLDVSTTFGPLEECLLKQEKRRGIQTSESDIYAIGMTLYKDLLSPFISEMSKKNSDGVDEVKGILAKLASKSIAGPFKPDDLKEYGTRSNYRMVLVSDEKNRDKDYLIQFPEVEQIAVDLKAACAKLTGLVSEKEMIVLTHLVDLSCQMQQQDKAKRPTIDQLISTLKKMKKTLSPDVSGSQTPPLKRNLSLELDKTPILELMSNDDPKSGDTAPLLIDGTLSLPSNGTESPVREHSNSF